MSLKMALTAVFLTLALAWMPLGAGAPAGGTAKLLRGQIEYTPPDGWELAVGSSNESTGAWVEKDGPGILAIQALPGNAMVDQSAARAIVKQLHDSHMKAKDEVVLEPSLETDDRFAIRIHERFKHKEKFADELHLYKLVGSRPCMLTVNAVTEDEAAAKKVHGVGEETLLSARFAKKVK